MAPFRKVAFITTKVFLASNKMGKGSGQNEISGEPIGDAITTSHNAMNFERLHQHYSIVKESIDKLPSENGDEAGHILCRPRDVGYATDEEFATIATGACAESAENFSATHDTSLDLIHFCFIVHGHKGRPSDLSYLHHTVKEKANFKYVSSSASCVVGAASNETSNEANNENNIKHDNKSAMHVTNEECKTPKRARRKKRDRFPLHFTPTRNNVSEDSPSSLSRRHQSLRKSISRAISHNSKKEAIYREHVNSATSKLRDPRSSKNEIPSQHVQNASTFIVHNAVCNEGRTDDGIKKGGERLANEIINVIRQEVNQRTGLDGTNLNNTSSKNPVDVTISVVGNSLGGLYGRYAIARLAEILVSPQPGPRNHASGIDSEGEADRTEKIYFVLDDNIRVHFNVFCTTASPHLGCANHTYITIPRVAEIGVAYALGETGRDLFRLNDLLQTMATSPRFLRPLALFRKRIAYANAFGTDFPVPGSTAAFLDRNSDYPHYFDEDFEEANDEIMEGIGRELESSNDTAISTPIQRKNDLSCPAAEKGLVVATLYTPQSDLEEEFKTENGHKRNDLALMSSSLDALGWKKIFIDMRKEIPIGATLPTPLAAIKSKFEPVETCPVRKLKPNRVVESRALADAISHSNKMDRITLPLGHNAICAFSRGAVSTKMNSGGRSVMDSLAIDLVNEISLWKA
mmetsp:Transcript_31666/g.65078  ORF Transcript_31666/g.65078 Transcript_31666/m.65078 type:complete len:690 (+) Transcript_31666:239-2308(+)